MRSVRHHCHEIGTVEIPSNVVPIDHQARLKQHRQISSILHPDRIMESIDDCNGKDLFKLDSFPILSDSEDELFCIQKLLKSLITF